MDPAAEAAIGTGNDIPAADNRGVAQDAVGDQRRVLIRLVAWLTMPGISILPGGTSAFPRRSAGRGLCPARPRKIASVREREDLHCSGESA